MLGVFHFSPEEIVAFISTLLKILFTFMWLREYSVQEWTQEARHLSPHEHEG